jgi:hypothetical protein
MGLRKKTIKDLMYFQAGLVIIGFVAYGGNAGMRCLMDEGSVFQWHLLLYPLAALAYFELLRRLDRRWTRRTPLTDEEILGYYAKSNGISEYEVFKRAAPNWSINPAEVEADFRAYLQGGVLPHYVRDFIRRLKKEDR